MTAASRAALPAAEAIILTSGVAGVMLALTVIGATSVGRRHDARGAMQNATLAVTMLAVGIVGRFESPVAVIAVITALCVAQLSVSPRPGVRER